MSDHFAIRVDFEGSSVEVDALGLPVKAKSGPRCGKCSNRHDGAKAIKLCHVVTAELDAAAFDEMQAEAAAERFFEDRGYDEARAQEDIEAARGVIPFHVAYAESLGLDADEYAGVTEDHR